MATQKGLQTMQAIVTRVMRSSDTVFIQGQRLESEGYGGLFARLYKDYGQDRFLRARWRRNKNIQMEGLIDEVTFADLRAMHAIKNLAIPCR